MVSIVGFPFQSTDSEMSNVSVPNLLMSHLAAIGAPRTSQFCDAATSANARPGRRADVPWDAKAWRVTTAGRTTIPTMESVFHAANGTLGFGRCGSTGCSKMLSSECDNANCKLGKKHLQKTKTGGSDISPSNVC